MSPEQARGAKVVGAASDQYAMGLIFYEMLTATRGHDGEHPLEVLHRIASGVVPEIHAKRPDLPADVEAIITRTLSTDPNARFPSLRSVARALIKHASEKARITYSNAFPDPASLPPGPSSLSFGAGAGAAAKSGGTRLLPKSGSTPPTTLGQSVTVSAVGDLRKSRRRPFFWLLVGATAAAVAVGVVLRTGAVRDLTGGQDVPPAATATTSGAPPAAELPPAAPPPAVAPPPVVQLPPPATTPPPKPESAVVELREHGHGHGREDASPSASGKHGHAKKHEATPSRIERGDNQAPILD